MTFYQTSNKFESLSSPKALPQLNHSSSKTSLCSPQSKHNSSFNLYFTGTGSPSISPQSKNISRKGSSDLFAAEPNFQNKAIKPRRSLISSASTTERSGMFKSNSFGSLLANQSLKSPSKLLPSIQFTQSSDTKSSLQDVLDVSLSPKKPSFNVSLQQVQSPPHSAKNSEKKTFSLATDFQATMGEINVMRLIEKQNATIAKLTQRIQDQEIKEKKLTRLLQEKDVPTEPTTSINMDAAYELETLKIQETGETTSTLKEVAEEQNEKEDEDAPFVIPEGFANVKKRKSILKISTRGQGSRRDSSRSSRVTFAAEEEPGSAKSIKDDFNEEEYKRMPQKQLIICKSASECDLNALEVEKVESRGGVRDKRHLVKRRSLFDTLSSQGSTRRNSDDLSETNSEDNSLSMSPQRERRSIKRVGRVTLPGRSKLGKILTTKISQDDSINTIVKEKTVRQKLNGVLWTMAIPNLLLSKRN